MGTQVEIKIVMLYRCAEPPDVVTCFQDGEPHIAFRKGFCCAQTSRTGAYNYAHLFVFHVTNPLSSLFSQHYFKGIIGINRVNPVFS